MIQFTQQNQDCASNPKDSQRRLSPVPVTLRLAISFAAISLIGLALFASPDRTRAGGRPSVASVATNTEQDATAPPILPAAGCTGANFNQPAGSPLSIGIQPRAMITADFNLDGKPDLAAMGESSHDMTIFLGDGSGGFSKTAASPIALGFSSVNLALGDFNRDGKPDMVVSSGNSSKVAILIGDGAGGFTLSTLTVPGGSFVSGLVVSDFNLDGKQDFAVTNFTTSNVSIMLGNGTGGFSAAPGSPVGAGTSPNGIASGDFNLDGKPDLAVSNISSNDVTVLLGSGNGSFVQAPQSPIATLGSFPLEVFTADLNSDGKPDLVTANASSSNVTILIGNGNGTFQQASGSPLAVASDTGALSIADFSLDGKLDLLVSDTSSNKVQLFLGDGLGGFSQASGSPITVGNTPYWSAVADYNLDGRPDFAVANYNSGTISVELNTCNAQPCGGVNFSKVAGSPFSAQNQVATTADFNLDGRPDLAVASFSTNFLSILLGNGTGGVAAAAGSPINIGFSSLSLAPGDFNLDGKPDLAIARTGGTGIGIMFGNGTGGFSSPQTVGGLNTLFPQSVAVADMNRDGKPDLVAVVSGGVNVLLGDGSGGFGLAAGSPFAAGSEPKSLALGDFNADGKVDVAVSNFNSNNVSVFLGDGTGGLTQAAGSPIGVGSTPQSLTMGDFNHDGKSDLATANVASGNVTVLLGNGSGGFNHATGSPFPAGAAPFSIAVGDFNLDGSSDLVMTNIGTTNVTILQGNGSGGFSQASGSPIVGVNSSQGVTVGDFNLDGRSDLVVLNNDVAGVTIDLNTCSAPAPTPTPTPTPTPNVVQFSSGTYVVTEACTTVTITVNRLGDTSSPATVDYFTSDVTATAHADYIAAMGTLRFAPGDTSKSFAVLINDDSTFEGAETFSVTLSNPAGVGLGAPAVAGVTIGDNPIEPATNAIDDAQTFVCQHYHDFLNRHPDQAGWDFWTNQITSCGADAACLEIKRINVSASFLLSIEFQNTGYLVERLYKTAYGDANGTSTLGSNHQLAVPVLKFDEFLADTQQITQGVVVLQAGWEQVLDNNTQTFIAQFVQRSRFTTALPLSMTPAQFVDTLNANAGNPLSQSERNQLVSDLSANVKTRAQVLQAVATDADLVNSEFNRAFVLMEYFGYLRRNPNDPQDTDHTGYDFWLTKLNQFNGNYINAEMVKAFLSSIEYRRRFGP